MTHRRRFTWVLTAMTLLATGSSLAADKPGSTDHPMISRYPGSEIHKFEQREFDAVPLLKAPVQQRGGRAKNPDSYLGVEGRLTRIAYRMPAGRSTLEVFRNYEEALRGAGFEILFQCENEGCGGKPSGRAFNEAAAPPDMSVTMKFHEKDQRYLLARLKRDTGDVHVSLYMTRAYSIGGQDKDRVFANLLVIESKPMQSGLVTVDAAAMAKGLDAEGHIALYNLYFDTGKDDLKPESGEALAEIAKLMKTQPRLKVLIVGHTDNVGALDFNVSLSERRAKSVVEALVKQHGIGAERMTAVGAGMAAPVASNDNETGRAKNRRVELVKR